MVLASRLFDTVPTGAAGAGEASSGERGGSLCERQRQGPAGQDGGGAATPAPTRRQTIRRSLPGVTVDDNVLGDDDDLT